MIEDDKLAISMVIPMRQMRVILWLLDCHFDNLHFSSASKFENDMLRDFEKNAREIISRGEIYDDTD